MSAPIDLDVVRDLIADGQPLNAKVAERMAVELEQWRKRFARLDDLLGYGGDSEDTLSLRIDMRSLVPEST